MFLKTLTTLAVLFFILTAGLLLLSAFSIPGVDVTVRIVQSGSMEPAIRTGSVVFTVPAQAYAEGDIITFRRPASRDETPVTHRIISVREVDGESVFTTQGDANETQDLDEVRFREVLGMVRWDVPFIGYILHAARTPVGFALFIAIPALLVIFDEATALMRAIRQRKHSTTQESQES